MPYSFEVEKASNDLNTQRTFCQTYTKLRAKYTKEEIKEAIIYASTDIRFWQKNFLSPNKLLRTNKEGTLYIDYFLTQSKIAKHEKQKAIGYDLG
jgi:hypothetical protein